jgi:hypothetical protein
MISGRNAGGDEEERNSPWHGAPGRTPGSHRPRCQPCCRGTQSSWRPPASTTATTARCKMCSFKAAPFLPTNTSAGPRSNVTEADERTEDANRTSGGQRRPNRNCNFRNPSGPGAENARIILKLPEASLRRHAISGFPIGGFEEWSAISRRART